MQQLSKIPLMSLKFLYFNKSPKADIKYEFLIRILKNISGKFNCLNITFKYLNYITKFFKMFDSAFSDSFMARRLHSKF